MNPTLALTRTRSQASLARRTVIRLLNAMPRGYLRLELPGGDRLNFGESTDGPSPTGATPPFVSAEIRIVNEVFFRKCLLYGDIGFGESYMDGDWETGDIHAVISWFLANADTSPAISGTGRRFTPVNLLALANRLRHLRRPNSPRISRRNISEHYDLSNAFFARFLDAGMTYSSGLWSTGATTLEAAQNAKYERLCQALRLRPEHRVLEIGCGWGGFLEYAARHYGCRVTGITLSRDQARYAAARIDRARLGDRASVDLIDYRRVRGAYDRIVSIEMLEAVGYRYLPVFLRRTVGLLRQNGLLGMQFITFPDSRYRSLRRNVDWIQKHIFPGSLLLSVNRINRLLQRSGIQLHEMHDMAPDYARTLAEWRARFEDGIGDIRKLGFDDRFLRKWRYYLDYCRAAFEARNISVVQTVHSAANNRELDRFAEPSGHTLPAATAPVNQDQP